MYTDPEGTAKWWEWLLGGLIIIAAIGLSVITAGVGSAVVSALGSGLFASIAVGAAAGAVAGTISALGISIGTQAIANGFNNINWTQVGQDVLVGAVSGAISGAVFGAVRNIFDAGKVAAKISGLGRAQENYNKALSVLRNTPLTFKGGTMATERVAALLDFNAASVNLFMAEKAYAIIKPLVARGYSLLQFGLKQIVGGLLDRWI